MKKLLLLLLFGCNSANNQMTNLLNERKSLEDKIDYAKNNEAMFLDSAKSTHNLSLADSSTKYFGIEHSLQERLNAVNFSIDSLGKVK